MGGTGLVLVPIMIFIIIISIIFVASVGFVGKHIRNGQKMMDLIRELSVEANNEKVDSFISYLEGVKHLNNSPATWDAMRAAFELVETSDHVSVDRKEKLRRIMMGLGVNRLRPIRGK